MAKFIFKNIRAEYLEEAAKAVASFDGETEVAYPYLIGNHIQFSIYKNKRGVVFVKGSRE